MKCSCIINNNFSFVIEYKKDHLLLIDKSEWYTESHNIPIETYPVTVINEDKSFTFDYRVNGTTMIKYSDLPSDKDCESDGIYTFKIDNCGEIYTRHEAILKKIMCSYSKLLLTIEAKDYITILLPIYREIEFIKVNSNLGFVNKAIAHYELVKSMLKQVNCEC